MTGGGGFLVSHNGSPPGVPGAITNTATVSGRHLTGYVFKVCIGAASGGLLLGYSIGITGAPGMSWTHNMFKPFSSNVDVEPDRFPGTKGCQHGNVVLRIIMASLYLAAAVGAWIATLVSEMRGRRACVVVSTMTLACGTLLSALSQGIVMFVIGRTCLGMALGFGSQSIPLYISEFAPTSYRGCLNMMFQLMISVGMACASSVTYAAARTNLWVWQFSLRIASLPAMGLVLGGLLLPEPPISLIWREKFDKARETLVCMRGHNDVGEEHQDLMEVSSSAKHILEQWESMMIGPILGYRYRPYLVSAIFLAFAQVATGTNAVLLYGPHLLTAIGFDNDVSLPLCWAIIVGVVSSISIMMSMAVVDVVGRKVLLFAGGMQMFVCQAIMGVLLKYSEELHNKLSRQMACGVLTLLTTCVASFAMSWASVGWTVPSEMLPLEIRSSGQSLFVSITFLFEFCMHILNPLLLCTFQHLTFLFFAGWVLIVTTLACGILPETNGIHLEGVDKSWRRHWFWEKYLSS